MTTSTELSQSFRTELQQAMSRFRVMGDIETVGRTYLTAEDRPVNWDAQPRQLPNAAWEAVAVRIAVTATMGVELGALPKSDSLRACLYRAMDAFDRSGNHTARCNVHEWIMTHLGN